MKVILLKDIANLGKINEVKEVSDGYAKNFLLKNKLVIPFTSKNDVILQEKLASIFANEEKKQNDAKILKENIESTPLLFKLKEKNGNTFGSISIKEILDELNVKLKTKITKFMIDKNIDKLFKIGIHNVNVKLHKNVNANIRIIIEKE
ncbi:MAG: 50S ribosomal protein L9 [Mycoplasmataceae bacterium]|jgi:large subunit ribosomal protein L9|nr:50S ribosomal protein L9 [Mycoplasmataceae bacterium]